MFRSNTIRKLIAAGFFLLAMGLLSACDNSEYKDLVGQTVTLSGVTQVDKMSVVSGWNATATAKDGRQISVTIAWKRSINSSVVNGAKATIKTIPASYGAGTATIAGTDTDYYVR